MAFAAAQEFAGAVVEFFDAGGTVVLVGATVAILLGEGFQFGVVGSWRSWYWCWLRIGVGFCVVFVSFLERVDRHTVGAMLIEGFGDVEVLA